MKREPLASIAIVGGDSEAWIAAAALGHALQGQATAISVIEPGEGDDGDLPPDSTARDVQAFHNFLGLDERDLMRITRATFKLGADYRGWWRGSQSFFLPLGTIGSGIDFLQFHQYLIKLARRGARPAMNDYSLCAVAAARDRFAPRVNDRNSPLFTLDNGLHLDGEWYLKYLRGFAEFSGVERVASPLTEVTLSADGRIAGLELGDGQTVEADLYVDCSGPEARLLGGALGVPFEDWSEWLPANAAVRADGAVSSNPPPYTTVTALENGWVRAVPLGDRVVHEYVFNADLQDRDSAADALLAAMDTEPLADPRFRQIRVGRRQSFWSGNCVALGRAAGGLEPLTVGETHLAQTGAMRLVRLLPDRSLSAALAEEYNRMTRREHDHLRDLHISFYTGDRRHDGAFWKHAGDRSLPDLLARKLRVFAAQGLVPYYDDETLSNEHWAALFLAQNRWPEDYNRCLDELDWTRLKGRFDEMRSLIRQAAEQMPPHGAYLARYLGGAGQ